MNKLPKDKNFSRTQNKGTGIYYFISLELSTGKRTSKVTEFTVAIT